MDELVSFATAVLDRLMPMHLRIDRKGAILGMGPTLARVVDRAGLAERRFFSLFEVRRPLGLRSPRRLAQLVGERMQLDLRLPGRPLSLRGICLPLADERGFLLNLSFGIGVVEAVRDLRLTEADFAPTDLAIEMLYLVEAKSAVMRELRELNLRLQGAKTEAEIRALTDTLTGLKNRRALELELDRLMRGAIPFALMHLDLDYFKQVNDTLGHAAGDHVLREVAAILSRETRASDCVARVGGDEFVLVFPALEDAAQMLSIAERIIAGLAEPIHFDGIPCRIAGSIGITYSGLYPAPDGETLLADADAALYEAKHRGRGRAVVFAP